MRAERTLRWLIAVLALFGVGIAGYLTVVHYSGGEVACPIGSSGGCVTVAKSSYSKLLGVPVSVWGLATYVIVLASALRRDEWGSVIGLAFTLIGVLFSGYLTFLELFIIDAICQWCVASAVVMVALFAACSARAWLGTDE